MPGNPSPRLQRQCQGQGSSSLASFCAVCSRLGSVFPAAEYGRGDSDGGCVRGGTSFSPACVTFPATSLPCCSRKATRREVSTAFVPGTVCCSACLPGAVHCPYNTVAGDVLIGLLGPKPCERQEPTEHRLREALREVIEVLTVIPAWSVCTCAPAVPAAKGPEPGFLPHPRKALQLVGLRQGVPSLKHPA